MGDKLYIIDELLISKQLTPFFESFISSNNIAIISSKSANKLSEYWLNHCKYVFASDGDEIYIQGKLAYKADIVLTTEAERWLASLYSNITYHTTCIHVSCDNITALLLVEEFNDLFSEFHAYTCSSGFNIVCVDINRQYYATVIDSSYNVVAFIHPDNYTKIFFELSNALRCNVTMFCISKIEQLQELSQGLL